MTHGFPLYTSLLSSLFPLFFPRPLFSPLFPYFPLASFTSSYSLPLFSSIYLHSLTYLHILSPLFSLSSYSSFSPFVTLSPSVPFFFLFSPLCTLSFHSDLMFPLFPLFPFHLFIPFFFTFPSFTLHYFPFFLSLHCYPVYSLDRFPSHQFPLPLPFPSLTLVPIPAVEDLQMMDIPLHWSLGLFSPCYVLERGNF